MICRFFIALSFLEILASVAMAHPVAQGAMEIAVRDDRIEIRARVSNEEAFVAEGFGGKANAQGGFDELWKRHGEYILAHLHFGADGVPLAGRVVAISPPETTLPEAHITYELRYDLAAPPRNLSLRQDVLNEFEFAPGNPWEATYIVRIRHGERTLREGLLFTRAQPLNFTSASSPAAVLDRRAMTLAFVRHGIAHILGGYDHLLFVAALVLAVTSLWDLAKVVTAFTLAHTITLTLAVLDLVRLPSRIVEPMIAVSIVVVALQNLVFPTRSRGWSRLAIAFGFGLFHGLGFAGGLLSAMEGMAGIAIFTAIAAFSIGVEIGHQIVALPLFGLLKVMRVSGQKNDADLGWAVRVGSGAICAAGMFYLVAALR